MGKRPWTVRVMVLGGLLAVAAGSWFTLLRGDDRAAEPRAAPPPPKAVRRMDRRAPMEVGRMGGGTPSSPIPHPAGPGVRSLGQPTNPVAGLSDPSAEVRISSAWKLKVSGPTEEALQPLAACLKDPDAEVRMAAASALGEYAELPVEVVRDLVNLARTDPAPAVALRALWAATGRGNRDLLDAAIGIYRARGRVFTGEKSPPICVLGAIARAGPGGFEFLKGMLRDPDPSVRRDAMQEIPTSWAAWPEVRKDPACIPLISGMLDDDDASVRATAAWALERLRDR